MPDPLSPHPPAPHRALLRHRELLAAIASGFVGALALATSTYNVYLQRQQVRAQVWPRLVMNANYEPAKGLWLQFSNRGVGPAEVRRVRVLVDGKRERDWPEAEATLLRTTGVQLPIGESIEDEVLSPGLEVVSFNVRNAKEAHEVFAQRDRMAVEICYCSTLGDCWTASYPGLFSSPRTAPAPDCAPDPVPFKSLSAETLKQITAKLDPALGASPADAGAAPSE